MSDDPVQDRALENVEEWGTQHPEELLSAIVEEVGEIEQAYLEATHEGRDPIAVLDEIDDLEPLLYQFRWSLDDHPMAFEPLPTAEEVAARGGGEADAGVGR